MRVYIITDLDEFAPLYATIDIIWDQPPRSVLESLPPPTTMMYGLLLQPQIVVDMSDGGEPPCHRLPEHKWCDRYGPGDFLGHSCGLRPLPAA